MSIILRVSLSGLLNEAQIGSSKTCPGRKKIHSIARHTPAVVSLVDVSRWSGRFGTHQDAWNPVPPAP
jgi:hypothetical protein